MHRHRVWESCAHKTGFCVAVMMAMIVKRLTTRRVEMSCVCMTASVRHLTRHPIWLGYDWGIFHSVHAHAKTPSNDVWCHAQKKRTLLLYSWTEEKPFQPSSERTNKWFFDSSSLASRWHNKWTPLLLDLIPKATLRDLPSGAFFRRKIFFFFPVNEFVFFFLFLGQDRREHIQRVGPQPSSHES